MFKKSIIALGIALSLAFSSVPATVPIAGSLVSVEAKELTQKQIKSKLKSTAPKKVNVNAYSGSASVEINGGKPYFPETCLTSDLFEYYSKLDKLGRCKTTFACAGPETLPKEERGAIGAIKPSGWHTVKYNDIIDGNYLYNRCHLLGYQITAENANVSNLITGTRYLNVEGMLPYEDKVADYIKSTGNHVIYRVTPIFSGKNLIADGVVMEAESAEDKGSGLTFCVYCYNVQPGIDIDYATGDSCRSGEKAVKEDNTKTSYDNTLTTETSYIININTKKFHRPDCKSVDQMKEKNKRESNESRDEIIRQGYSPCKNCNP